MEDKNYNILIVDDEIEYQRVFSFLLKRNGYKTTTCSSGKEALEILKNKEIDLVMTDLKMPQMDGVELVKAIKKSHEDIDVMIITAFGSIESAVEAMQYGAAGYSIKNSNPETLLGDVDRIAKVKILEREKKILMENSKTNDDFFLESKNEEMKAILDTCKQVAESNINVLILGESGVGKEIVARHIHNLSHRSHKMFIPVNCQVFSEGTLESELFGHEKGAFTGASEKRIGRFEAANHGTLFLDEIGDIPYYLQGKLLRAIENKEIERVGSNKPIELDIRLISATNKKLDKAIEDGVFREDLLYRINTLTIVIPPLRERREDIPALVDFFVKRIEKEQKKKILQIDPLTLDFLYNYDYPGNIRELKNLLERMVALSDDGILHGKNIVINSNNGHTGNATPKEILPLRTARGIFEKEHIERTLEMANGNMSQAAEMLQITKRQLWNKISEYNIKK